MGRKANLHVLENFELFQSHPGYGVRRKKKRKKSQLR